VTFEYLVTNADSGDRLASATTALVSLDRAGRPAVLPPDFRRHLERTVVEPPAPSR
jgi:acyl-CoA thioesterase FadM